VFLFKLSFFFLQAESLSSGLCIVTGWWCLSGEYTHPLP
jgi:hypothetical protein